MKQHVFSPLPSHAEGDLNGRSSDASRIGDLVHELRQPLSAIESMAYYLELTCADEKTCAHARQIQAIVQRAHRILSTASETQEEPTLFASPQILALQDAS
jgi:signal transduction histidine kinase